MRKKSRQWLEEHYQTIGGSQAPVVLGKSKWKTPSQLAREIRFPNARPDLSSNKDVRRGTLLEPIARQLITEAMGRGCKAHPQDQFVYNPDYPFAHVLPDGWVRNDEEVIDEPCEIKVPRPQRFRRMVLEGLPEDYVIQAMHSLAVTEAPRLHFAVMCCVTMDLLLVPIERDDEVIGEMMEQEAAWKARFNAGDTFEEEEPEARALEFPSFDGEMVTLRNEEATKAAAAWIEADDLVRESEELKAIARGRLIEAMGDNEVCEVPEMLRLYHRRNQGRRVFNHKECVLSFPETKQFYKDGEPFTSFRPYRLTGGRAHD